MCVCVCVLVDVDAELAEVNLGLVNLLHQLLVRFGHIVKGEDAEAETKEEERPKGDESPKGKDGDDLLLDQSRERNQLEVEGEIEGRDQEAKGNGLLCACHCWTEARGKERL